MSQTTKKADPDVLSENEVQQAVEKWLPDTFLKFDHIHSNIVCATPADFLVAEHQGQDMFFSIIHPDKIIKVARRMAYKEFWQHMPDGLMEELIRGVAIQVKRISEIRPEKKELVFDHKHTVKLEHEISPETLKHIGDSKVASSPSPENSKTNS